MPFTLAHPSYLFWLKNKWKKTSISAIVISSIVPDFDILFRLTDTRIHIFNYNFQQVFLIILPISIALWWYYEWSIKKIYVSVFPFMSSDSYALKDIFSAILVMILSIYVHLFLDLISHWNAANFQTLIGVNSGNIILSYIAYYFSLYVVSVLFSLLGFYFILSFIKQKYDISYNKIRKFKPDKTQILFAVCYLFMSLFFFSIKFFLAIKEKIYIVDIAIINFTGALIFSFFASPWLYLIVLKIKSYANGGK